MGIVWKSGSLYVGPHGAVFWMAQPNRSANNYVSLATAAYLRFFPTQINNPELDLPTPDPDPSLAPYGDLRVMAWNGGASDTP
jgi:hypothetical protein